MDVKAFAASAPEMSAFVKSLANPVRLRILCALSAQELSVGALSPLQPIDLLRAGR
jgi:ArsR family transcriptional regulator, virulence genes transcriptional regulator